ncbi:adenosylcobinamide-phosphate synthase CbiB [Daeguia caeni]|uniref:Cobalamin biosynthesis protein CobD n=1 Tax=Daeguia caeni TaxID=439612 RepID=A0ABV9H908_9HYPH
MFALLAFLALIIEWCIGYPHWLYLQIGHPVTWTGKLIEYADKRLNLAAKRDGIRRATGTITLVFILIVSAGAAWHVQWIAGNGAGILLAALLGSSLLAQRSLSSHVEAVANALENAGLDAGRNAVSMIVGRNPATLDEAGVARAAIESLAENFSDGVVAPAFWMAVAGLPGAAIYKAANTADSMIGHRTPRHEAFGWAAARFDDIINLPASRLSGILIVMAAFFMKDASPRKAFQTLWRDAGKHRSPNAGWPEAAMAGALGLALAGPRTYGDIDVTDAIMGEGGRRAATAADIRRALSLYRRADALLLLMMGGWAGAMIIFGC